MTLLATLGALLALLAVSDSGTGAIASAAVPAAAPSFGDVQFGFAEGTNPACSNPTDVGEINLATAYTYSGPPQDPNVDYWTLTATINGAVYNSEQLAPGAGDLSGALANVPARTPLPTTDFSVTMHMVQDGTLQLGSTTFTVPGCNGPTVTPTPSPTPSPTVTPTPTPTVDPPSTSSVPPTSSPATPTPSVAPPTPKPTSAKLPAFKHLALSVVEKNLKKLGFTYDSKKFISACSKRLPKGKRCEVVGLEVRKHIQVRKHGKKVWEWIYVRVNAGQVLPKSEKIYIQLADIPTIA